MTTRKTLDHLTEAVAALSAAAQHQGDLLAAQQAARAHLAGIDAEALVDVSAHIAALAATGLEPRYPHPARGVIVATDARYLELSWWWDAVGFALAWLEPCGESPR
ncbi:hypothetical protein GA0070616_1347 [Micromonospora nigra]|uniref:Uncharacterized protein n=1 Tax=Micromonospora nigra TaxID=145857 RepID=A0A1C6RKM7_9ACTN|nr:hypothetical protein [Micromonospora nigra]SCL17737.1 hypothetical protein GA0070616_1347 [Micromonospora nigra]